MDADGTIQLLLGRPTLHGCAEALGHLASIWTQVVEPNDAVLWRASVTGEDIIDQTHGFKRWAPITWQVRAVKQSYAVQLIADDLGVAFVVVSAWNSELQRPEQCVEHLNKKKTKQINLFNQFDGLGRAAFILSGFFFPQTWFYICKRLYSSDHFNSEEAVKGLSQCCSSGWCVHDTSMFSSPYSPMALSSDSPHAPYSIGVKTVVGTLT